MPQVPTHTEDERDAQRRMRSRFLGMAIGVVLAVGLWLFVHPSAPRDAVVRHDRSKVHDLLARRSRESVVLAEEPRGPRAEDRAWFISEQDARVLFAVSTRGQRYDAFSAYAHNPNLNYDVAWSEHPRGHWLYRTNSIGLREDGELAVERPDLRVIVTGDSHVDGFCDNADSFPHVLGARLAVAHPSSTVEVINAADGGYSFYNYSGVLAAHLALRPHVFVVTVHGGNDFLEVLLPHRYFARLPPEPEDPAERARSESVEREFQPALFQGLSSVAHFARRPADVEVALDAAFEVLGEMKRVCGDAGIDLVCVYLPSPIEIERVRLAELIDPGLQALQLTTRDVDSHAAIGPRFVHGLAARGVRTVDSTDALRAAPGPCFWRADLHLNLLGQRTLARVLESVVMELAHFER